MQSTGFVCSARFPIRRARLSSNCNICATVSPKPNSTNKSVSNPVAGTPATNNNAKRLAKWLAADWDNKQQAIEHPTFWAHIHVCFRPLPWQFLQSYSFYCESAYDYNLGAPYKTSVVEIINDGKGNLELVSYKVKNPDEYWLGSHEPELLEPLTKEQLVKLPDECNTIYGWDEQRQAYIAGIRPGNKCIIRRGGKGPETYLDSKLMLTKDMYAAWDLGRDPETHERVWGTAAGPFTFTAVTRLDHLVPDPAIE